MIIPGDLITDADLIALDANVEATFGEALRMRLPDKRRIAVTDWLAPALEAAGYVPTRHRTRQQPQVVRGCTSAVYTDYTTAAGDNSANDVPLANIFATPASDYLYVGHRAPFTGLFVNMTGTVNAVAASLAVAVWNGGGWVPVPAFRDETLVAAGKTLSGGGRLTWQLPDDWAARAVDGASAYWVRLSVSAALTAGTVANQILPIVRSRLALATALYTLSLIYREGSVTRRGAWQEQATTYADQAAKELAKTLPYIKDEFDMDADDAVGATESENVRPADTQWSWERY